MKIGPLLYICYLINWHLQRHWHFHCHQHSHWQQKWHWYYQNLERNIASIANAVQSLDSCIVQLDSSVTLNCHEFRFSIVRILLVSVSNVTSLQDCICNCPNGKTLQNCLNCRKIQICPRLSKKIQICKIFKNCQKIVKMDKTCHNCHTLSTIVIQ